MVNKEKKVNKNIKKQPKVVEPVGKQPRTSVFAVVCFLFAFLLYSNTLNHSYALDDIGTAADNNLVEKGVHSIPKLLVTDYRIGSNGVIRSGNLYRPLSLIMFAVEWQISPNNPHFQHFINVLFYAISCVLLFIVLRKYVNKAHTVIPFLITLLYAAHPIHSEVVANIKSRDEIMSFLFLMLTLVFLHNWFISRKWKDIIFSVLMFFLALLSKEGVITMLFLFPVMGWYFTDAKPKTILSTSLLMALPAAAYILIRQAVILKSSDTMQVSVLDNFLSGAPDAVTYFTTCVMLLGKYLWQIILPYQQVSDYSFNQLPYAGLSSPLFIISLLVYLAMAVYVVIHIRKKNPLLFGLLFFLITISMYSNILFRIGTSFGERLMFLPSLGVCIALVYLVSYWLKPVNTGKSRSVSETLRSKPLFTTLFVFILLLFSIKTVIRAAEWKDNATLFENDVKRSPGSARLHFEWASMLCDKADKNPMKKNALILEAIDHYKTGISILEDKNMLSTNSNYAAAMKSDPTVAMTWLNIGLSYYELGDFQNAIKSYDEAIAKNPKFELAFSGRANAKYHSNNIAGAIADYDLAIKANPDYSDAYLDKGRMLGESGRFEESVVAFQKCIEVDPENIKAYKNLSLSYQNLNQPEEAKKWFDKANELELKLRK